MLRNCMNLWERIRKHLVVNFNPVTSSTVCVKISKMAELSCGACSSMMKILREYPKAHAPWTLTRGRWYFALRRICGYKIKRIFFTSLWETNQLWFIIGGETSSNSHPQASCNPALLRSSGSRGKENLDWSSPSVLMSKISEFGSQDSACNRQITVRSQYWECKCARYCFNTTSLPSRVLFLSPKACLRAKHTSQLVNKLRLRNPKMSDHRRLYTSKKVPYLRQAQVFPGNKK
jgi:hypothetical protein